MHDLVISGGLVVDGSGAPARHADVAVEGETISAVGADLGPARRHIDATGLLVTPGFVDIHTHYDAQATWDPWMTPSSWHGVTTAVMGSCGVGFAPAAPDRHEWLIELMEGVEDIPGTALVEGITWGWESFEEYLDALDATPRILDLGTQVAHGPVRAYVMGERGAANEPATTDDVEQIRDLVERALRAGALGFSTSRTPIHRSKSGELVPGTTADADELLGIGDALRRAGHGVFQYAPEHKTLPSREWGWMRELARRTGRVVSVNLNQADDAPEVWREVLNLLDAAHRDGLPIVAQAAGRSIGLVMCLQGSLHPLMFHPAWASVALLPHAELVAALRDPAVRERFLTVPDDDWYRKGVTERAERMYPMAGEDVDYEPAADRSVADIARRAGTSVMELILDLLLDTDGTGMLYVPFFNYSYGDLSFTHALHLHPHTRMGLSDAGAHCGVVCDGGTPTFMLTHWTRDRTRGPRLGLEATVHRQTRQTAELFGLRDRGLLAPGLRADINLIDYDTLGFERPRIAFDLPGGARRLVQRGRGYRAVFCAGVQTVADDEFTGALPGRLVRGPKAG